MPKVALNTSTSSKSDSHSLSIFNLHERLPFLIQQQIIEKVPSNTSSVQRRIKAFPEPPDFSSSSSSSSDESLSEDEEEKEIQDKEYCSLPFRTVNRNHHHSKGNPSKYSIIENNDLEQQPDLISLQFHKQSPFLSFTFPALNSSSSSTSHLPEQRFTWTVYKHSILPRHLVRSLTLSPSLVVRSLQNVQLPLFPPTEFYYWTLIMCNGGHFAAAVFDNKLKRIVVHKTFHRYITRRGQGGVQSANDQAKGNAKSAGASIRRYNESALQKDIAGLFEEWTQLFAQSDVIFVHAPGQNKHYLFGKEPLLPKDDARRQSFPFSTRRPTLDELERAYKLLSTAHAQPFFKDIESMQLTSDADSESCEPLQEIVPCNDISNKPLEDNDTDKKINPGVAMELVQEVMNHVKAGDVDAVKSLFETEMPYYNQEGIDLQNLRSMEYPFYSLLHVASLHGHVPMVQFLLEKDSDPCLLCFSEKAAKTPYEVALNKETRNAFRLFMAENLSRWDWNKARVPSPLTREMLENQESKLKEKKSKAKKKKKKPNDVNKEEISTPAPAATSRCSTQPNLQLLKKLQSVQISTPALSEEAKKMIERERRARAAEERMKRTHTSVNKPSLPYDPQYCANCSCSLSGKIPFEKLQFKYCSVGCVRSHQERTS